MWLRLLLRLWLWLLLLLRQWLLLGLWRRVALWLCALWWRCASYRALWWLRVAPNGTLLLRRGIRGVLRLLGVWLVAVVGHDGVDVGG